MIHQKMARRTSIEVAVQHAVVLLVSSFHLFNALRSALTAGFSGMLALMSTSCRQNSQFFQNLKWPILRQTAAQETATEAEAAVVEAVVAEAATPAEAVAVVEAAVAEAATPVEAVAVVEAVVAEVATQVEVVAEAVVEATGAMAVEEAAVAEVTVVAETATAAGAPGSEQEIEAVVAVKIHAQVTVAQVAHRRVTGAKHEGNPTNHQKNLEKASVEAKPIEAITNLPRVDSRAVETVARIDSKNAHSSSLTVVGGENTP